MPFIPHTAKDIQDMLAVAGVDSIDDLFDEIPPALTAQNFSGILPALNEMQLGQMMRARASVDRFQLSFLGAGAYEHHIPAAVWEIAGRGEWMTAYTPYQAEASQGTLQLLYEYQTMMAGLMAMDVSNASLYDGASGLAEAILMAVRLTRKKKPHRVLIPDTLHPHYQTVVKTIVNQQDIELIRIPFDATTGCTDKNALDTLLKEDCTALVVPQPNFFGMLEDVDTLTNQAQAREALVIGVVNPTAMALLKPPGQWGSRGADIACGEGQPLGIPLASGGPYFGFLCTRERFTRQLPGRIAGRTVDKNGRPGFVLTLQAREQHIRRARATSNICTNQGLLVTAATIYMSLLGPVGLRQVAQHCHRNALALTEQLLKLPGIRRCFSGHFFHECALHFDQPLAPLLTSLEEADIQAGLPLKKYYPSLGESLLICATETKTQHDLTEFISTVKAALHGTPIKGHVHA